MGKKIFVSYKYSDKLVYGNNKTARNYVDCLQELLDKEDHINKGENDDESMDSLEDSTIASKLGDKIYDSTVTIVLISKGMKDDDKKEKEQWIPWEVSYSLREQSRKDKNGNPQNSKTNAMLAVVLPDENNSYEYFITRDEECDARILHTNFLFKILKDNMFNIKSPDKRECNGSTIYSGDSGYISSVKWSDFEGDVNKYIDKAIDIYKKRDDYKISLKT